MNKSNTLPFTGVLVATFVNMLMQTLVAAILPHIVKDIGGGHLYGWVFSSFLLISTITIPLFAKLADENGYKLWFLIGMGLFLIGTYICGIASSMPLFLTGRTIQGIGVGAIGPVTIALISHLFSMENRGSAMGVYAATQIIANVSAPLIGTWITESWNWSYAFYAIIPFGLLSSLLIIIYLPNFNARKNSVHQKFDWIGALLLGGTIALFIQGCTMWGKSDPWVLTLMFAFSLVFGICFVIQERRHENPVIPARLIKITNIRLANASAFLIGFLMYGLIAILPLYGSLNATEGAADKILIPLMVGLGLGIIVSGRFVKKFSYKLLATIGWTLTFLSCVGLVYYSLQNTIGYVVLTLVLLVGWGVGTLVPTFLLPAQNAVSSSDQAVVGGFVQLSRNSGGAIGIPILTTILALPTPLFSGVNGYSLAFAFLGICATIGYWIGTRFTGTAQKA